MPGSPLFYNANQHLPAGQVQPTFAQATGTNQSYQIPQGYTASQFPGYVQQPHDPGSAIEWLNMEIGRVRAKAR
jgi:hypothetical protein